MSANGIETANKEREVGSNGVETINGGSERPLTPSFSFSGFPQIVSRSVLRFRGSASDFLSV
jgi:hypothetical protein